MDPQVRVRGLRKRYGQVDAVADVSFDVRPDEILGILGPNGAGKTTTLEIIEGLRRPDHGEVVVAGVDVRRNPRRAKARIGVQAGSMRNSAPATAPRPWCGRSGTASSRSDHALPARRLQGRRRESRPPARFDGMRGGDN